MRIIARLNIGGPAIHTILLTSDMQTLGYETLLVAGQVGPEEGDMAYLAEAQVVKPIIVPQLGQRFHPGDNLVAFFKILRLLFAFRPHIVHSHTAKAGTLCRLAAFIYNRAQSSKLKAQSLVRMISKGRVAGAQPGILKQQCRVVHTFHGHVMRGYFSAFVSGLFQGVEKTLAKVTDTIIVVSSQQKEELCNGLGIGRPQQYRVVSLGFDLTPFSRCKANIGQFRTQLGLSDEAIKLVAIIGRITPIKNHRFFLEAISRLPGSEEDVTARFVIIGDGELRGQLEGLTHQLGLADRVVFTGWIKDMATIYADLDVVALTSDNEGTPVAVIEAMAAGVPVIATDVGGVRELIADGEFPSPEAKDLKFEVCQRGIMVNPGDVDGFANGLRYLLQQPDLCKQMGQRGREYALTHHSKERLIADMDRLYRSLLQ